MAKRLGLLPDALIRARPNPKLWIHELHLERYGYILGRETPSPKPLIPVAAAEAARAFEEQVYWEEYWERNDD